MPFTQEKHGICFSHQELCFVLRALEIVKMYLVALEDFSLGKKLNLNLLYKILSYYFYHIHSKIDFCQCCKGKNKPSSKLEPVFHEKTDKGKEGYY